MKKKVTSIIAFVDLKNDQVSIEICIQRESESVKEKLKKSQKEIHKLDSNPSPNGDKIDSKKHCFPAPGIEPGPAG